MSLLHDAAKTINQFVIDHYRDATKIIMSLETRNAMVEEVRRTPAGRFIPDDTPAPRADDILMGVPIAIDDELPYAAFVVEGNN